MAAPVTEAGGLLLALLLTGCAVTAPPRDNAQFQTTVRGVDIVWRYVNPGTLSRMAGEPRSGHATWLPGGQSCVVDLDPALAWYELARVAAHEAGHCLQARYLLPGLPRPDLGPYYAGGGEGFAQTYALAYLRACGPSLRALGWEDITPESCDEAPDPLEVYP